MTLNIVSFEHNGQASWGVVTNGGIIDIGARRGSSVWEELQSGFNVSLLTAQIAGASADFALSEVTLQPPVVRPEKIICIGVNYANRNAEYKDSSPDPEWPSLFMRGYESFTGAQQDLWRPPESPQLDYEGEIVMIIGKEGHRIPQGEAMNYVAGYTLMNEGTIRDWVRHAKFNVTQGQELPLFGQYWAMDGDSGRRCRPYSDVY